MDRAQRWGCHTLGPVRLRLWYPGVVWTEPRGGAVTPWVQSGCVCGTLGWYGQSPEVGLSHPGSSPAASLVPWGGMDRAQRWGCHTLGPVRLRLWYPGVVWTEPRGGAVTPWVQSSCACGTRGCYGPRREVGLSHPGSSPAASVVPWGGMDRAQRWGCHTLGPVRLRLWYPGVVWTEPRGGAVTPWVQSGCVLGTLGWYGQRPEVGLSHPGSTPAASLVPWGATD
ncbi:hypothetical protein NDU88_000888 [Pleurodeles waltl]|uniref:Uncharacterized protein n=1 Tax=Pleurodeles waltl TaxID=8319 RepID=A0AAV7R5I9_PLEWA|nr:hypothetical protein NDU88_000888 [Pleurodeles waltl]